MASCWVVELLLGFARGAGVELLQLLLVLVASLLAPNLAGGGESRTPHDLAIAFFFFAAYSAIALWPARDLVEGWLGMFAGRQPARYADRGENVGRALIAFAPLALLGMPAVGTDQPPEVRALAEAFCTLAIVVFGPGSAIPRIWFAIRGRSPSGPDEVPELLRESGRRGAHLFYAAFLGLGLGLVAARLALQPPPRGHHPSLLEQYNEIVDVQGNLCRPATASCPDHRDLGLKLRSDGDLQLGLVDRIDLPADDTPPRCELSFPGSWPLPGSWPGPRADRVALAARLNRGAGATTNVPSRIGDDATVRLAVPDGADACQFHVTMVPPADSEGL